MTAEPTQDDIACMLTDAEDYANTSQRPGLSRRTVWTLIAISGGLWWAFVVTAWIHNTALGVLLAFLPAIALIALGLDEIRIGRKR